MWPQCGCKRRFASAQGLLQHKTDAHGGGSRAQGTKRTRRNRATKAVASSSAGAVYTESGHDLIRSIAIPALRYRSPGLQLLNLAIHPSALGMTRLKAVAALWARWRPLSLKVTVQSAGSMTLFGSMAIGWCADPTIRLTDQAQDLNRVLALKPSVTSRVVDSRTLTIPCDTARKWYHTDGALDESAHGALVAVVATPFGGATSTFGVTVMLEWKIQFEGIEMGEQLVGQDIISVDSGWGRIFTTSDSSFDSDILTFKETPGGAMAPFSAANPSYVYKPYAGTVVHYYDGTGALLECKHFARVQNYATPGLVLFTTKEAALAYVKDGDVSHCIKYNYIIISYLLRYNM